MQFTRSGQILWFEFQIWNQTWPGLTGADRSGYVASSHWLIPFRLKDLFCTLGSRSYGRIEKGGAHRGGHRRRGSLARAWTPMALRWPPASEKRSTRCGMFWWVVWWLRLHVSLPIMSIGGNRRWRRCRWDADEVGLVDLLGNRTNRWCHRVLQSMRRAMR
jgi:hypothetical protein